MSRACEKLTMWHSRTFVVTEATALSLQDISKPAQFPSTFPLVRFWVSSYDIIFSLHQIKSSTLVDYHTVKLNLVCEIPRSFERSSPSNFRTQGSFIHINSGKSFERDLLSSGSVAKSATQNLVL